MHSVILKLRKLDPLGKQADAIERGNTIHTILEEFIRQTQNELPENASNLFMKITNEVLKKDVPWPAAQRLWLARMQAISSSFIKEEIKRRAVGINIALERYGEIDFQDLKFKLTQKQIVLIRVKMDFVYMIIKLANLHLWVTFNILISNYN